MNEWKLIKSMLVYSNFMQVEKRTYELPNGVTKDYDIKLGKSSAVILALTSDNKVIISRQFRPGPEIVLDEIPGGVINVEAGESPEAAAARELEEETGYTGEIILLTEYYVDAYATGHHYGLVATDCKKTDRQNLDYGEDITVKLKDLPDFIRQVRSGLLTNTAVALLGLDHLGLL